MKELKPSNYRNFKQTVVVKNQINTVNGKLMLNANTTASTRASYTFNITQSAPSWDTIKQENIAGPDGIGNSHCMARSIVGCGMITLTHDFELDTPIVSAATVNLTLGGKSYKLASNTHAWDEGKYDNVPDAADFIINHAQHTESTWTTNSEYVDYEKGKVPLYAWVKDASYLVDYEVQGGIAGGWTYKNNTWQPTDDVASKIPPATNQLTPWLTNAWAISGNTGFKASNGSGSIWGQNTGYWTQNGDKVQDKMMYPNPLPNYSVTVSNVGTGPTAAYLLTLSFKPSYRYIEAKAQRLDSDGYRWRVTITIPRFYVYLAICRAAQVHIGGILNFNNGAESCPSLGFADYVESAQIDLIGEVLDESSVEFSQVLDENGNPTEGSKDHIERLSDNELLTQDTAVNHLLDGKVAWRVLAGFSHVITNVDGHGGYEIYRYATLSKDSAMYEVIKNNYELGATMIKVREIPGVSDFFPGDVYEASMNFIDNYSATEAKMEVNIKGVSPNVSYGSQCYVSIYGYADDWFTGSWKDWVTKLLINTYDKGKLVVNCDVEAPYVLANGGLKINDFIKFKDIYNKWIIRNGKVVYFEVKNIRKVFESSHYLYQLTLIESNYGEQQVDSIKLLAYTDYRPLNNSNIQFYNVPPMDNETGFFLYLKKGDSLVTLDKHDFGGILNFQVITLLNATPRSVSHLDIAFEGAQVEITSASVSAGSFESTVKITVHYTVLTGSVTGFDVLGLLLNTDIPSSYEAHNEPWLERSSANKSLISGRAQAITTGILVDDAGYIRLDEYDEFNDSLLYVVRCPIWAVGRDSEIDVEATIPYELIDKAGFYERYGSELNSAKMFKTYGHSDSGTANLLYDRNYEYLLDSEDEPLEVDVEADINYIGLYMVALLQPNKAQISNGIVPVISNFNNFDKMLSEGSWGQGQVYHVKGRGFESLDVLWNMLIESGELNNYQGKVYPLPSIDD